MAEIAELLATCASIDAKRWLEDKIIETRIGAWELTGGLTSSQSAIGSYPKTIPGAHDQELIQFEHIEYFLLGKPVSKLPAKEVIFAIHRLPDQVCTMTIDGKVNYKYKFADSAMVGQVVRGKVIPPTVTRDSITDLYAILYSIVCNR